VLAATAKFGTELGQQHFGALDVFAGQMQALELVKQPASNLRRQPLYVLANLFT
jgi:hypothetical protein